MRKIILFTLALVITTNSLLAADLQNTVTRAIVKAQSSQVCDNPLGLTQTTFDGNNYLLVLSNDINNYYVPENIQNNYVDQTRLNVAIYYQGEYPDLERDEIEYADERNPDDVLYAFTRSYNQKVMYYSVMRVVREKRNRYVHYKFIFQKDLNQSEKDFQNIVNEHHLQWINAVKTWIPPKFDSRRFSCAWNNFVENNNWP